MANANTAAAATTTTYAVTVAAVKKTRHGAYGRALMAVTVTVTVADGDRWEAPARAAALPLLTAALPGLKLTTDIVRVETVTL